MKYKPFIREDIGAKMYFSGLKRAIQDIEEKKFYDIALIFLESEGYKSVSIIDGKGDGGRDVTCSRNDLRIQLSIRKDWQKKINSEAAITLQAEKRHFIYITNRVIRDTELDDFLTNDYTHSGEVEITVYDLNRISSRLAASGSIKKAYEKLGYMVDGAITATPKEIALSNVLLFSKEAKDLRADLIESNIKSYIYKCNQSSEDEIVGAVSSYLPGADIIEEIKKTITKLTAKKEIKLENLSYTLTDETKKKLSAAEEDYLQSIKIDLQKISEDYSLSQPDAKKLIELSLEILAKEGSLNGEGIQETSLLDFISNKGLNRRKNELYEDLSKLSSARIRQYGKTIDHIFSTNTFDIYRALGKSSQIKLLLDSSVAMPLLFGLCFGSVKSRYSIAAAALHDLCKSHNIPISIPRYYVNEIVHHGKEALNYVDVYNVLNEENKAILRNSSNSYLSHYSHLRNKGEINESYTISKFLEHFGIMQNAPTRIIENKIESILESFDIKIIQTEKWNNDIREELSNNKPNSPPIIIDHDSSVCTFLKNSVDGGYIFATWDKVMSKIVEGKSRILANTPARVIDFLAMAEGVDAENTNSYDLLTSLIYCDEAKAAALARKIDQIDSAEKAYEFQEISAEARNSQSIINISSNSDFLPANDEIYDK